MARGRRWKTALAHAASLALFAGLAALVRWPQSYHLGALSLDPNTPLHALVADNLFTYGALSPVRALDFPEGQDVQVVGVPLILLAWPLRFFLDTLPAFSAAVLVLLTLQGASLAWLGARLGWPWRGRILAGAAAITCPYVLHVSGNGQFENLAFPALALCLGAGLSSPLLCAAGGSLGLLGAGFSSPYQAVPAGAVLLLAAAWTGRRQLAAALLVSALAGGIVAGSYLRAIEQARSAEAALLSPPSAGAGQGGERSGLTASAGLYDLISPRALFFRRTLHFPSPAERLAAARLRPEPSPAGPRWRYSDTPQVSYQGLALLLLGIAGLAASWRERWARAAGLAALGCTVLALGPSLSLWSGTAGGPSLPWAWLSRLPVLGGLSATYRFLSGLSFPLALGAGALASRLPWPLTPLAAALLLADGLLRAPVAWPLPCAYPRLDRPRGLAISGPVAVWPPVERLPGQLVEGLALTLGQPVSVFRAGGTEGADAWYARVRRAGVRALLRFEDITPPGEALVPPPALDATERCAAGICWQVP